MLRPIAPEDSRLLAATFGRLSEESRYRRFFTTKDNLSAAELEYFVDIAISDHEAIVAINPSCGELLGVARYIRSPEDGERAEVAVTVVDDWQGRGLGRSLLDRLTYRARREGGGKGVLLGAVRSRWDTSSVQSGLSVEVGRAAWPWEALEDLEAQELRLYALGWGDHLPVEVREEIAELHRRRMELQAQLGEG